MDIIDEAESKIWDDDEDVKRIVAIFKKYGIDYSPKKIMALWGSYCSDIRYSSWLTTEGIPDEKIFAKLWFYEHGVIKDFDHDDEIDFVLDKILKTV
jgi:hypothetical protein